MTNLQLTFVFDHFVENEALIWSPTFQNLLLLLCTQLMVLKRKKCFPRELACLIMKNMFCVFGFGFQSFPSSQIDFKPKLAYTEQFSEQEELFSNLF